MDKCRKTDSKRQVKVAEKIYRVDFRSEEKYSKYCYECSLKLIKLSIS